MTVTPLDVVTLPAASRARALSVCEPLATGTVFQEMLYGAAVSSAPRLTPSSRNCTPATPMLSDALAETTIVPVTVEPLAGAVMAAVGNTVSGTVTVTTLEVATLPAASRATAVSW